MSPILAVLVVAATPSAGTLPNLDFSAGRLTHWQGEGFTCTNTSSVTSADPGPEGRTAILHRTFHIPAGTALIRFSAAAIRPAGTKPAGALDIVLEAANREIIPRLVRQGDDLVKATVLLPPDEGRSRQYVWNVEKYAGRRVRIALVDGDDRPGCHIVCSGFTMVSKDEINAQQFSETVRKLEKTHKLRRLTRYRTSHFIAYSNADPGYTEYRLYNCETIHALFFDHFRKRGFAVAAPTEKMMVALFDSQGGFEAYLGQKMSAAVTGVYHPPTNRLVVYDYATNRAFMAGTKRIEAEVKRGGSDLERERRIVHFGRFVRERRNDTNITTIMHEVAHQLSFNCGLLNRTGDVPTWLAEGLAVYCESTIGGAWQGIGEANPLRAGVLVGPAKGKGEFLSLRSLVANDDWIRKATRVEPVLLGYSQSWALFRMLMEEEPRKLKKYLAMIYDRRTAEHRLTDFAAVFGTNLAKLERRYQAYLRSIARKEAK